MATRDELTADRFIDLYVRQKLPLAAIGERYGVSRQRIHQLKKEYEKSGGKLKRRQLLDVISLKGLVEKGWSAAEIADKYGVRPSYVRRQLRRHQEDYRNGLTAVSIRPPSLEERIPSHRLRTLYMEELLTDREIACMFRVSPGTICRLRRRYRIAANHDKTSRQLTRLLPRPLFERLYRQERKTLKELSVKYDCSVATMARLKAKYRL